MADESIKKDFVDGVQEIFTTLFNTGKENDGLNLYLLSTKTKENVYGESKAKVYQKPICLVTQAHINPTQGEQDVETVKGIAQFVVPLKDLQDKELDVSTEGLSVMRQGVVEFHGTYYTIDNIIPKAYVEDVFLLFTFHCTEDLYTTSLFLEPEEETGGDSDGDGTDNDGGLE